MLKVASLLFLALGAGACDSSADRAAAEERTARESIAASNEVATRAAAAPSTGLWTEELLVERLVRAGVAPRAVTDVPEGPEWMQAKRLYFRAGGGELHVWIYTDSVARAAVTSLLDASTATPSGRAVTYEPPLTLVVQNNLAAVITGGDGRNHERIMLALQAGLPVRGPGGGQ